MVLLVVGYYAEFQKITSGYHCWVTQMVFEK